MYNIYVYVTCDMSIKHTYTYTYCRLYFAPIKYQYHTLTASSRGEEEQPFS